MTTVPLSERLCLLLYEIYNLPLPTTTQVVVGSSLSSEGSIVRSNLNSLSQILGAAIQQINQNQTIIDRVTEILEGYDEFALDPSGIEKEGYSFNPEKTKKALLVALKPYTGITFFNTSANNLRGGRIRLG